MSAVSTPPGLCLLNARLGDAAPGTLHFAGGHISALGGAPRRGERVIDLRGDRVLPGLINAHDHLQLNALPRLKSRPLHANAGEWIDDMRPRLAADPLLRANAAVPRALRLLIGGLKNLLTGVTTVAHHDAPYPELLDPEFPVRVLEGAGWSHSLALDGDAAVRRAHDATAPDRKSVV